MQSFALLFKIHRGGGGGMGMNGLLNSQSFEEEECGMKLCFVCYLLFFANWNKYC